MNNVDVCLVDSSSIRSFSLRFSLMGSVCRNLRSFLFSLCIFLRRSRSSRLLLFGVVGGGGVTVSDPHWACGPARGSRSQSQLSHQLSREQVQVTTFSVTVSPSLMILPDEVLQFCPGGDGDGVNINNNNSSNNNQEEEEDVCMVRTACLEC